MTVAFDHLVVGADDLDAGGRWARESFGVDIPVGGAHPSMSTHNRLARLPTGYLEIIAIDRAAPPPDRARWYGLDDPATQERIRDRPRAIAWVLATPDLDAAVAGLGWDPGEIVRAARGALSWRITVPEDGGVVDGVLPTLIEWPESLERRAPTAQMPSADAELREIRLRHPDPTRIAALLERIGAVEACRAAGFALEFDEDAAPGVQAAIAGPSGPVLV